MAVVDLAFPVSGYTIPRDHGYALYGTLARLMPSLHEARDVGIFAISGTPTNDGALKMVSHSTLRLRLSTDRVSEAISISGKAIDVGGHTLRIGVPRVHALVPAPTLASRVVLIKLANRIEGKVTPGGFVDAARKQLEALGVRGEPFIPLVKSGPYVGQPRRRVVRVKGQTHVGYSMIIESLSAAESICLQEAGLGGRRLMGCGLFEPERGGSAWGN